MSQQYLVPCTCGQKVRVEAAQAGGQVPCACGLRVAVPTLRGLKQLELAPSEQAAPRAGWSQTHGAIFSTGLFVALVAAVVAATAFVQYLQVANFTEDQTDRINLIEGKQIDSLSAAETVEIFREWQADGLGVPHTPGWIEAQKAAAALWQRMLIAASVGGLGILAAIFAALIRPRRSANL